jgi:hypothetical protein
MIPVGETINRVIGAAMIYRNPEHSRPVVHAFSSQCLFIHAYREPCLEFSKQKKEAKP